MEYIKIGSIVRKISSGGTPKSTKKEYYGGNIPWLNTKEINFNRIYKTEKSITKDGLNNSSAKYIKENCVIVAMYGATAGRVAINKIPLTTNQACCNIEVDENKMDYNYLYYAIKNDYERLASFANGGAQQNLNSVIIKEFEIPHFDIKTQKKISKILTNIDKKIELNNEINNNLHEICNSIYHSFLDKYSNLIIDTKLVDIAKKVITGKTPSTKNEEFWNGNIPFITIPDMHNQLFTINTERTISKLGVKSIIPKNSIAVSCIATVGLVSITTEESQTNQQINSIIINNDYDLYYLFEFLSEQAEYLKNIAGGSTTYNINKKTFENIVIPYLPENLLKKFNDQVSCLFERIKENQIENKNLEQLRDTLLPKLLNGEINLENIEI